MTDNNNLQDINIHNFVGVEEARKLLEAMAWEDVMSPFKKIIDWDTSSEVDTIFEDSNQCDEIIEDSLNHTFSLNNDEVEELSETYIITDNCESTLKTIVSGQLSLQISVDMLNKWSQELTSTDANNEDCEDDVIGIIDSNYFECFKGMLSETSHARISRKC